MGNITNQRIEEITVTTLIVGVDIAKTTHWASFTDYRGITVSKTISFQCNRTGFEKIVTRITEIRNNRASKRVYDRVIIGMEPTGHYWKTLAHYLQKEGYRVVGVNPYHTKRAKELDDNSPTKNDKKDALTIARLVKDGRYFNPYLPIGAYAELRALTNSRASAMKRSNAVKNTITAILDEYFPEITEVFKNPLTGKASRQVLKSCPFPTQILALGETGVLAEIKKAVKRTVGIKKVRELIKAASESVGVTYGITSSHQRLVGLLEELDIIERRLAVIEVSMAEQLSATGYAERLLSIKGIGVVTAAEFLGEVGDPLRFDNWRQIANYAGYNLVEDSSGKSKSGTVISKRGRSQLRSVLYQMAFTMVGQNAEMKSLHKYMTTRDKNPLKKKQSLIVISKKIIAIIYNLLKKKKVYDPALVFGTVRQTMLDTAA